MEGREVEVRDVTEVGDGTVALDLEAPPEFDAEPGQFVQVGLEVDGEKLVRHYTISSPRVGEAFEITVGVDPDGDLSPALADLRTGDTVEVDGPYGRVYYEGGDAVVLAGGPGVGPAVGIGERAVEEGSRVGVVYRDSSPAHRERLERLEEESCLVRIVDEGSDMVEETAEVLEGIGGRVYIYGFAGFVEDAEKALERAGYDGEAEVENFG